MAWLVCSGMIYKVRIYTRGSCPLTNILTTAEVKNNPGQCNFLKLSYQALAVKQVPRHRSACICCIPSIYLHVFLSSLVKRLSWPITSERAMGAITDLSSQPG